MLMLTGNNTYSGSTTIAGGMSSATGTLAGTVTVNAGCSLAPGIGLSGGSLSVGSLTLKNGALLNYALGTGATDSSVAGPSSGRLTLNPNVTVTLSAGPNFAPTTTATYTYPLATVASGGTLTDSTSGASGEFTGWLLTGPGGSLPPTNHQYLFAISGGSLDLEVLGPATVATWGQTAGGTVSYSWTTASNWNPAVVPSGSNYLAVFPALGSRGDDHGHPGRQPSRQRSDLQQHERHLPPRSNSERPLQFPDAEQRRRDRRHQQQRQQFHRRAAGFQG